MADIERALLYMGTGFIFGLFLMSRFSVLRPATTSRLSSMPFPPPPEADTGASDFHIPGINERKYGEGWVGERPS